MLLYPCNCCKNPVKSNQKALCCTKCKTWIHTKCASIPDALYNDPSQHFVEWQCPKCILQLLPFSSTNNDTCNPTSPQAHSDNMSPERDKGTISNENANVRKFDQLSQKGLKFCHLNVASLLKNLDEIRLLLKENDIDVFALNETRLDDNVSDSEISIPGYNIVRKDRNRAGGGVAMYVKNSMDFQVVEHYALTKMEATCIKICIPNSQPIFCLNWYRPPNSKIEILDFYENFLEILDGFNAPVIIMGDVNCDIMDKKPSSLRVKYTNINNLYSMEHINSCKATRITNKSATLIDHMLTNSVNYVRSFGVMHIGMSDHSISYLIWKGNVPKCGPCYTEYRNMKNFDIDSFKHDLREQPWDSIKSFNDINDTVCRWEKLLMQVVNKHMPIRRKRVRQESCPWMNSRIHTLMKERDKLKKRACKEKNNNVMKQYRSLRNKVTGEIKKAKKKYYIDKLNQNQNNSAEAWKTLKSLIPNKKSSNPALSGDNKKSADEFNTFFAKVGENLAETIPPNKKLDGSVPTSQKENRVDFELKITSEDGVLKELKKLKNKKSTGLDGISSFVLKLAAKEITPSLTYIINKSIIDKVFPSSWKVAKVIPLFKKGDKSLPDNYRPISLLPVVSKVLERVIHVQLLNYLNENDLLALEQSGFRPMHSTQTTLAKVTDDWLDAMSRQCYTGVVFVDLRKAFDTVDHNILLQKMACIGVSCSSLKWFKEYLSDRKIVTQINNTLSSKENISYGVPQGSILGPLMFIIYINDIVKQIKNCSIHLYADDTVLYYSDTNPDTVQKHLQEDLNSIYDWMCRNKLSMNCKKTVCMLIGNRKILNKHNDLDLKVNAQKLDQVAQIKYLGITVDEELNWNAQVEGVCKKVSKMISFMGRLRQIVPEKYTKLIYDSMILPQLEYADIIWDSCKNKHADVIQKLQNRAGRIILKISPFLHTPNQTVHKMLKWDTLACRRKQHLLQLVYKAVNGITPSYLQDMFCFKDNTYLLRSDYNIAVKIPKNNYAKRMISYRGGVEFNELPVRLKRAPTLDSFKQGLKEHCL